MVNKSEISQLQHLNDYKGRFQAHYFDCTCASPEHVFRFMRDPDDGTVCLEVHLVQWRSFFKRAWVALKYVFGYRSRFGHWDITELHPHDARRMIQLMEKMLADVNEHEEKTDDSFYSTSASILPNEPYVNWSNTCIPPRKGHPEDGPCACGWYNKTEMRWWTNEELVKMGMKPWDRGE